MNYDNSLNFEITNDDKSENYLSNRTKIEEEAFYEVYGQKVINYILKTFAILSSQEEFRTSIWNNKSFPSLIINTSHSITQFAFPTDQFGDMIFGRYNREFNNIELFFHNIVKSATYYFPDVWLNPDDTDEYNNTARYLAVLIFTTIVHELYHANQYMGRTILYNKSLYRYYIEEPVEYMTSEFIKSHPDLFKQCTGVDASLICFNLPRDINTNYITQESYESALKIKFAGYEEGELPPRLFPY